MDLNLTPIKDWGLPVDKILLGAGPCSAESEQQLLETAKGLVNCGVSFLRAGVWKPRTRPGSFEGVGLKGLGWLDTVKRETGLAVGVEVATAKHVEACLEFDIDLVWIGARTTPNPFAIQELCNALRGTDLPVLVKNPVSPDLGLWLGAIERLAAVGITKLGVIHRGFSSSTQDIYRNSPNWRIPIELHRRLPELPLICDPSHICGKTELIPAISQEAVDLLFDGLMIEVHPDPPKAMSDSEQQLTPEQYKTMLADLVFKRESTDNRDFLTRMDHLRSDVDELDENMLELLGKRMEIVREMGELKKQNDVSVLQPDRWEEIVESRIKVGKSQQLSEEFLLRVLQLIHEEAIRQQEENE